MNENLYAIAESSRNGKIAGHLTEIFRDTEEVRKSKFYFPKLYMKILSNYKLYYFRAENTMSTASTSLVRNTQPIAA